MKVFIQKNIKTYFILSLILASFISALADNINSNSKNNQIRRPRVHRKTHIKRHKSHSTHESENKYLKFVIGLAVGFGLGIDATEELKNCFKNNSQQYKHNIKEFIAIRTNSNSENIMEKEKNEQKESATSFTKIVLEFFSRFKECNAFRDTIFTFVKSKIINIGLKGLAYVLAGPLGLLLKGTYDIYKLISEVSNFYSIKNKMPLDYYNLGSSVGKIVYYAQNILLKRRRKL